MAQSWFWRGREATPSQLIASGAALGSIDPVDGDRGFTAVGTGRRETPRWTTERARAYSVAAYRSNPMARAIIDTYVSFCVGDSGVQVQTSNSQVAEVVNGWWNDPRNRLGRIQEMLLRDHMLMGESVYELMVGPTTGVVRFSPIDPDRVVGVRLDRGNPLWPNRLVIHNGEGLDRSELDIVQVDDISGLRTGQVGFYPSWRALITDRRGFPFLGPVLDSLDAYDQVLNNLIDRTSLARYLVWDVTLKGNVGQTEIDDWIRARGGTHVPRSGTVEVHNESVEWKPQSAQSGSFEDTNTLASVLTGIAGGTGLAKTWLADPEGANRATSQSMAEPVRRRVGGVQNVWLEHMTEFARFVVDRAVAVGRLPRLVEQTSATGDMVMVPAADTVKIVGPEIAASDAQFAATVLLNLSQGVQNMVEAGVLTKEAGAMLAQRGWEQFMGQPFRPDLAANDSLSVDDLAGEVDKAFAAADAALRDKAEAAATLVRAGFDPAAVLGVVKLPPIAHTGLVPITVKPAETGSKE